MKFTPQKPLMSEMTGDKAAYANECLKKIFQDGTVSDNLWGKWKNSELGIYQLKNGSSNFDIGWEYFFEKDKLDMMKLMESTSSGTGE